MFSKPTSRIPPLTEAQQEGLRKRRWKRFQRAGLALHLFANDYYLPRSDEASPQKRYWKHILKLCDRFIQAWANLNDGLECGTVERLLEDISRKQQELEDRLN